MAVYTIEAFWVLGPVVWGLLTAFGVSRSVPMWMIATNPFVLASALTSCRNTRASRRSPSLSVARWLSGRARCVRRPEAPVGGLRAISIAVASRPVVSRLEAISGPG